MLLWLAEESGVAVEDCPLRLPVLGEAVLGEAEGFADWLAEELGAVAEAPLCVAAPELWLLVGVAVVSFAGA